jgi:transcriptional regulator
MHPNPAFRQEPRDAHLAFARARGFGALCVNAAEGPLVSHVPFLLDETGASAELHLVRSNPILRLLSEPRPAVLVVSGPDGYVSPDWYGVADQVPTWNYVAVHLRGTLAAASADELEPMLDRLSAAFETRLAPKPAWTSAKMSDGLMERMMRMIAPYRLEIATVEGTWKLNQNKPKPVRLAAADRLEAAALDPAAAALAALMRAGGLL